MNGLVPKKGLITKEEMIPLLVAASPAFEPQWAAFRAEWQHADGGPPYSVCLGDLARYLAEKLEQGDTADFPAVFRVVERLHLEGDSYVKEAATVGLLEGIQNILGAEAAEFVPYLEPETKRWWDKLNDSWEEGAVNR